MAGSHCALMSRGVTDVQTVTNGYYEYRDPETEAETFAWGFDNAEYGIGSCSDGTFNIKGDASIRSIFSTQFNSGGPSFIEVTIRINGASHLNSGFSAIRISGQDFFGPRVWTFNRVSAIFVNISPYTEWRWVIPTTDRNEAPFVTGASATVQFY